MRAASLETETSLGEHMREQPVMLKVLLRDHHWQNYSTFCAEYDKAARQIDPKLAGSYPSRAQTYRWLTGSVAHPAPYGDHRRVLEEMFPRLDRRAEDVQFLRQRPADLTWPSPAGRPPRHRPYSRPHRPAACARSSSRHSPASTSPSTSPASLETLHGVIQEPLDKIRLGTTSSPPRSPSGYCYLDTTAPG